MSKHIEILLIWNLVVGAFVCTFADSDFFFRGDSEFELNQPHNSYTCGKLPAIPFGQISNGGNNTGDVRNIDCPIGYELKGNTTLICGDNGQWLLSVYCSPINRIGDTLPMCGEPPKVADGTTGLPASYPVNTAINIICNNGFSIQGRNVIVCTKDGLWTAPGTCQPVKTCGPLPNITNGVYSQNLTNTSTIGTVVTFQCRKNTTLVGGASDVFCKSDGNWTISGFCIADSNSTVSCLKPLESKVIKFIENIGEMPRIENLVLYISYDNETGTMDTVNNTLPIPNKGQLQEEFKTYNYRQRTNPYTDQGPFEMPNSSFLSPFGFYKRANSSESFTLAMFLRPSTSNPSPILMDAASIYQNKWRFSLLSNNRDIELHVHSPYLEEWPPRTIKSIKFINVLKEREYYYNMDLHRNIEKRVFSFFAITYDNSKHELTLYDQSAAITERIRDVSILSPKDLEFEGGIFVGKASQNKTVPTSITSYPRNHYENSNSLAYTSAVSCLSYHSKVLTDVEIASLQCACQFKGKKANQLKM